MNCYKKSVVLFLTACTSFLFAEESSSNLLELINEFEIESDLSKQTKQESLGHTTILTRQDIDRLRLYNLRDLMQRLSWFHYNETSYGLEDVSYMQKGPRSEGIMKIFLDDVLLVFPYQGTGQKYYSRINFRFIDHVEIYWGFPSFTMTSNVATTVIKLYSQKPERENSSTIGARVSNKGSYELYGYSAHSFEDFSYLLNINRQELNRDKMQYHEDFPLSRDQETNHLFAKFMKGDSTFSFSALRGNYDGFIGDSLNLKTYEGDTKARHFIVGWDYKNDDKLKFSAHYTQSNTKEYSKIKPISNPYILTLLNAGTPQSKALLKVFLPEDFPNSKIDKLSEKNRGLYKRDMDERVLSLQAEKEITYGKHIVYIGTRFRYSDVKFNKYIADGLEVNDEDFDFTQELISTFYTEYGYMLNDENMLVASFKYNYYDKNVEDMDSLNGRFGYIHNGRKWFVKTFITHGQNGNDAYHMYNYYFMKQPESTKEQTFSNEVGYKFDNAQISTIIGYAKTDTKGVPLNSRHKVASLNFKYDITPIYNIRGSYWYLKSNFINGIGSTLYSLMSPSGDESGIKLRRHGGFLVLSGIFNKLVASSSLNVLHSKLEDKNFYNLNINLNYKYNRNLELYLTAENLLKDGPTSTYSGFDDDAFEFIRYEVPLFQRAFWLGVEYSF